MFSFEISILNWYHSRWLSLYRYSDKVSMVVFRFTSLLDFWVLCIRPVLFDHYRSYNDNGIILLRRSLSYTSRLISQCSQPGNCWISHSISPQPMRDSPQPLESMFAIFPILIKAPSLMNFLALPRLSTRGYDLGAAYVLTRGKN